MLFFEDDSFTDNREFEFRIYEEGNDTDEEELELSFWRKVIEIEELLDTADDCFNNEDEELVFSFYQKVTEIEKLLDSADDDQESLKIGGDDGDHNYNYEDEDEDDSDKELLFLANSYINAYASRMVFSSSF
ncbi:hypothetical protein JCGZ_19198 [Jatropha curcas]|uniref:Uncharacterized protein n=1 Tax=Jatropha curcas TaxID=180498 RepID=A0A067L7A6_JATCU|nr:hypothetical protein JCGZ_19198 [Jatropha curcas]